MKLHGLCFLSLWLLAISAFVDERPNIILISSDDVAFALLDWLPDKMGGDAYAGIDQRFESIGAATVDLVAGRLNRNERGLSNEPHVLKVAGQWIDGASFPPKI